MGEISAVSDGDWWLYMVETAAGQLYTGITTDVSRRVAEHEAGKRGARALRGKGPLQLRLSLPVGDRATALRCEYRVKQLSRLDKQRFIDGELALDAANAAVVPASAG